MCRLKLLFASVTAAALFGASAVQGAEPVKIRLSWVAPVTNWASIMLEKKDLAKHLGNSYTLEPVRFAGTPPMVTALANGELEVANLAYSTLAIAIQNAGMDDLRVIADERAGETSVEDVMTREVVACSPDDDLERAEELLGAYQKSRIMRINEEGELMGVISLSDLAHYDASERAARTLREVTEREAHT